MSKPERRDLPPQPPLAGFKPTPSQPDPKAEAKLKPKPKPKSPSPWPWGRFARIAASLAIAFHLAAVFTAPWAIQMRDSSQPWLEPGREATEQELRTLPWQQPILPGAFANYCWYYANLLYINNGYNFFSPNPGVSHLVEYRIVDEAGQDIYKGQMPDRREQWPRLLYHRYMMLVEQSAENRRGQEGWVNHIGEQLLKVYGGERVRLDLMRHHLLTPMEVLDGQEINSRSTITAVGGIDHYRRRANAADAAPRKLPGGSK